MAGLDLKQVYELIDYDGSMLEDILSVALEAYCIIGITDI